jgi:uncharacterized Zn finger protein (UPF0148 family)
MKFECPSCGKTLNVKDDYAGKKARCPGCKEVLTVPYAPEAAAAAAAPAAQTPACPNCNGSLAEGAVFCVACGFDLRSGKKHETVTSDVAEEEEKAKEKEEAPADDPKTYSRDERG